MLQSLPSQQMVSRDSIHHKIAQQLLSRDSRHHVIAQQLPLEDAAGPALPAGNAAAGVLSHRVTPQQSLFDDVVPVEPLTVLPASLPAVLPAVLPTGNVMPAPQQQDVENARTEAAAPQLQLAPLPAVPASPAMPGMPAMPADKDTPPAQPKQQSQPQQQNDNGVPQQLSNPASSPADSVADGGKQLYIEEQKQQEQQRLKEQQLKGQQLKEHQEKEQQLKEQQLKDQQLKAQQLKEQQQLKERQAKEQQQLKEQQQVMEQKLKEQQLRDQQLQQAEKARKQADAAKKDPALSQHETPANTGATAKSSPPAQTVPPKQQPPSPAKAPQPAKPQQPTKAGSPGSKQQAAKGEKKPPLSPAAQAATDFANSVKGALRSTQGQAPERVVTGIRAFGSSFASPQPAQPVAPVKGGSAHNQKSNQKASAAATSTAPPVKQLPKAVMPKPDTTVPQSFFERRRDVDASNGNKGSEAGKAPAGSKQAASTSARSSPPTSGSMRPGNESAERNKAKVDDDEDDEEANARKAKKGRGEAAAKTVQMIFDVLGTGYSRLGTTIVTFDYPAAAMGAINSAWQRVSTASYNVAMADYETAGQRAGAAVSVQMRRLVSKADATQETLSTLSVDGVASSLSSSISDAREWAVSAIQSWWTDLGDRLKSLKAFDPRGALDSVGLWVADQTQNSELASWGQLLKDTFVTKPMEDVVRPLSDAAADKTVSIREAVAAAAAQVQFSLGFPSQSDGVEEEQLALQGGSGATSATGSHTVPGKADDKSDNGGSKHSSNSSGVDGGDSSAQGVPDSGSSSSSSTKGSDKADGKDITSSSGSSIVNKDKGHSSASGLGNSHADSSNGNGKSASSHEAAVLSK